MQIDFKYAIICSYVIVIFLSNSVVNHVKLTEKLQAVFGCCKTFSGKYIFSENAIFRKRKMFPCVWLHFKKFFEKYFLVFGKEEGKHKSENTKPQPRKKNHQRSQHKIAIAISDRDRFVIAIAIQIAIASRRSRSRRDRDLVL